MNNVILNVFAKDPRCIPTYATHGSSGFDFRACIDGPLTIEPDSIEIIPTGLYVSIIRGYEIQVRSRSGLAIKHGLTVINSPGTVDSDYRGEILVGLFNMFKKRYTIDPYERIAQGVVCPVIQASITTVDKIENLGDTIRGGGGLGSTGAK